VLGEEELHFNKGRRSFTLTILTYTVTESHHREKKGRKRETASACVCAEVCAGYFCRPGP